MIPEISADPFPSPCADQAPSLIVSPAVCSVLQVLVGPWPLQCPARSAGLHYVRVSGHPLIESSFVRLSASPSAGHVELASEYLHPPVPAMKRRQVCHAMPRRCPIEDAPRNRHTHARSADNWHIWAWYRRTFGVAVCTSNSRRVCVCVASTCRMGILLLCAGSTRRCGDRPWGRYLDYIIAVFILSVDLPY